MGTIRYTKPYKSVDQLIGLLKARGLAFDGGEDTARRFLSCVNYYRFTGYAIPFLASRERFRSGSRSVYDAPPLWSMVEVASFGALVRLYRICSPADQNAVSSFYGFRRDIGLAERGRTAIRYAAEMRDNAEREWSMDDINAEISAARKERKARVHA